MPLFEINLEKHSRLDAIFATLDVKRILQECEFVCGTPVATDGKGILFLDEIQAAPNAIAALRYFYEELPALPVIAAGSLLEFALARHNFSMPVGRVEFFYLGPMLFSEFLDGCGEERLSAYVREFSLNDVPSELAHEQLLVRFRDYLLVGGMPEAVGEYVRTGSITAVSAVHESIIETYRSDFSKYATLEELTHVRRVFEHIPFSVGEKIKYVKIDPDVKASRLRAAFDVLALAGVITPVRHTAASGIPLAAQVDESVCKPLFFDVGLMNAVSGIRSIDWNEFRSNRFVNEGKMAGQFAGQHLLYQSSAMRPSLLYWLREGKKNNAEVDYLLQIGTNIVPVEIKAGKTGSLKSLQLFAAEKASRLAVRLDLNPPSCHKVEHHLTGATPEMSSFMLLSLPLPMVERCRELAEKALEEGRRS